MVTAIRRGGAERPAGSAFTPTRVARSDAPPEMLVIGVDLLLAEARRLLGEDWRDG
jgi:hypothetical protein